MLANRFYQVRKALAVLDLLLLLTHAKLVA